MYTIEIVGMAVGLIPVLVIVVRWIVNVSRLVAELEKLRHQIEICASRSWMIAKLSGQAIYVCRDDGYNVWCSDALTILFGIPQEEIKANGWAKAIKPSDRIRAVQHWKDCVKNDVPYRDEYTIIVHGREVPVLTEAFAHRDSSGRVVLFVGYVVTRG